jgi:hypothetical protein
MENDEDSDSSSIAQMSLETDELEAAFKKRPRKMHSHGGSSRAEKRRKVEGGKGKKRTVSALAGETDNCDSMSVQSLEPTGIEREVLQIMDQRFRNKGAYMKTWTDFFDLHITGNNVDMTFDTFTKIR